MRKFQFALVLAVVGLLAVLSCSKDKGTGTVTCSFTLTHPSSGASWAKGSTQSIQWWWNGAGANVKLELYKGSSLKCAIVASTANDGSYSWVVDDCGGGTGSDYTIKISDAANATCSATSASFSITVPCSFTVTSPSSGASWTKGSTQSIQWTSTGAGANVKLELYKGSSLKCAIVASTANNGSYAWTVDDCASGTGSDYTIKISDAANAACNATSANFSITMPCTFTLTRPSTGANWTKGSTQSVQWTSSHAGANVKIELFKGSFLKCNIATSTVNNGSYSWMVDDCGSGTGSDYKIKVYDLADVTCSAFSANFSISVPCSFTLTNPSSGASWTKGSTQSIQWASSSAGANVKLELYKGSSLKCAIVASTANNGSYSWAVNDCGGGTGSDYSIKVSDIADNTCGVSSANFSITVPCTFTVTSPSSGVSWAQGSTQSIHWTSSGAGPNVTIELYKGPSLKCATVWSAVNNGSYSWVVDDCGRGPGSDYIIKVSDAATATCGAFSANFSITVPQCTYSVTSPASAVSWLKGSTQTLQWSKTGSNCGGNVKVSLYKGGTWRCDIAASVPNTGSYVWTTDDCNGGAGSDYQVGVIDLSNPTQAAYSGYFQITVPCSILVTSPTSGTVWPKGSTQTITWTSTGSSDSVAIYLYKGQSLVSTLSSSLHNGGAASWTSVSDFGNGEGTDYRIKIADVKQPSCYTFSNYFGITLPCNVLITSPTSASVWSKGSTQTISWIATGFSDSVSVYLYKGPSLMFTLASSFPTSSTGTWQVNDYGGGNGTDYRIVIQDRQRESCYGFSDYFTITGVTGCTMAVTLPNMYNYWATGQSKTIDWVSANAGATVRIELYLGGAFQCLLSSSFPNSGAAPWTVSDCGGGTSSLYRIRISDVSNPTCIAFSEYFAISVPSDVIQSVITSNFNGFNVGNQYTLANGQIWQQTEYYYWYYYWYHPAVTITTVAGVSKMKVEGIDHAVTVVRIQ